MSAIIALHPQMTAQQIAEWCARHRMIVAIDYVHDAHGQVFPLIRARRETSPEVLPAFLRLQAGE